MEVACLMQATMSPDLQKNMEDMNAFDMIEQLKGMFQKQARQERYDTMKQLISCKMQEGSSVSAHVLKMKGYIDQLNKLGYPLQDEMAVDFILNSLSSHYDQFVMNFNMNDWVKTVPELHGMLKTAEMNISNKVSQVLMVRSGGVKKPKTKKKSYNSKNKGKAPVAAKPATNKSKQAVKAPLPEERQCYECNKMGHWKRNCPEYLAKLKVKKANGEGTSSGILIYVIELFTVSSNTWVFDTGCGYHIINVLQEPEKWKKLKPGDMELIVGDGKRVPVLASGTFNLTCPSGLIVVLNNCLYAPGLTRNIISVSLLYEQGFRYVFNGIAISAYLNGIYYFEAKPRNGIYEINVQPSSNIYHLSKCQKNGTSDSFLWHCRLGHISKARVKWLQSEGILESTGMDSFDDCESYLAGKLTKDPFTHVGERASDLLGLIHSDVCGPFRTMTRNHERYFVTFIDDYSRYAYVYLMKHKHETFEKFKEFQNEVENQLNRKIKMLRSDRGGEYLSLEFLDHLKEHGIVSQPTPPGTPQLNGVCERRNRTLLNMIRSMMCRINLPHSFWGFALMTAARLVNLAPTKKVNKTPYEIWHGHKPNLSYLRVWGCDAYITSDSDDKLDPRGEKVVFVGYYNQCGYYFYHPDANTISIKRKAKRFLEDELLSRGTGSNLVDLEEVQGLQATVDEVGTSEPQQIVDTESDPNTSLRRSIRTRKEPDRYLWHVEGSEVLTVAESDDEPTSYKSAISNPDSAKWLEAMKAEMQSMRDNQVWDLVELPPESRAVGSKWVFKRKTDMHGNIQTYKARLVAKGFTQTQGIDYDETFSPIAMIKSIRILLAIAAYYDYEIWQMDVKTAFLNGHLSEDVYMVQPDGFIDPKYPNRVCKLNKSIYGLKQASRSWNLRFDQKVKEFGFVKNEDEPCVYRKASGSAISFLILYVDDILMIGNNIPMLKEIKHWLGSCFAMKDLGEAAYILGIKIYRNRSKRLLGLTQSTYIDQVMKRFKMENSKKGGVPMTKGTVLDKSQAPSEDREIKQMERVPYASAIGSIMYAMVCTRPDVSYALSMTSRYQQNPGVAHWTAVKNILKYLRRTKDMFLIFGGVNEELTVKCYTDASFQTDRDTSRSQTGFVFTLNGGAVSWKSSKQSVVADSTTESEYIAASDAAKEAAWMKKFITDLDVVPSIMKPIQIFCDNTGAIAQAKEPRSHHKAKHILRKFHYIREIVERGDIVISKIDTDQNLADPFTKPMTQEKHDRHMDAIGLRLASEMF
ncbi:putative RNA-directed DNA polymerase [Helianthus annuus]|uniref:RNA-directed DNA polymerase n=1 Tax=Helianthus annuus TaxID=4232 RepID=A0A9K3IYB3_HELAN|nr:putative RNA-directed DNA polymerase [Helianthus annuus]KAJ0921848.1 putative RNA-directed DNA polymerase [Helianthus annuus]